MPQQLPNPHEFNPVDLHTARQAGFPKPQTIIADVRYYVTSALAPEQYKALVEEQQKLLSTYVEDVLAIARKYHGDILSQAEVQGLIEKANAAIRQARSPAEGGGEDGKASTPPAAASAKPKSQLN